MLFELRADGEVYGYRLVHPRGWVAADAQTIGSQGGTVEPAAPEQLRTLALDPDLRW